jgi:hypothetical protein
MSKASLEWGYGRSMTSDTLAIEALKQSVREAKERARGWSKTTREDAGTCQAMTALANLFPTLRGVDAIDPWNEEAVLAWTCGGHSSGALHAAKFALSVWNPAADWNAIARARGLLSGDQRLSPFDVHDAIRVWDYEHRAAFVAWMQGAFWR